jgi:hypothetical protein
MAGLAKLILWPVEALHSETQGHTVKLNDLARRAQMGCLPTRNPAFERPNL